MPRHSMDIHLQAPEWCTKPLRHRTSQAWAHPKWEDVPADHSSRDIGIAFALGNQHRAGSDSLIRSLDENLMYQIVTCYLRVPIVVPDDCR